ncbi:MAG: hypothetical protein HQM04_00125 [Magnetococcales bacterium]|nr:hypothetical protein [Magnetococcales bacterium]MBF0113427.1 hypothetical protein [Magnetococcales bacterium]
MEIFAFYSFKGGVGRTALLTNLAAYWASLGKVVGLVDMDLSAPGLSYSPLLDPQSLLNPEMSHLGFSDLLDVYYAGRDEKDGLGYFDPDILFHELRPPQRLWGNHGRVLVIPAGNVHFISPPSCEAQALPFPPKAGRKEESNDALTLRAFAALFKRDMQKFRLPKSEDKPHQAERGLDYLLIDCRTGFPELADLVLGYLADRMVLLSSLNQQNLVGLDITLHSLRQERVVEGAYARDLLVVFSPVPVHLYDDPAAIAVLNQGKQLVDSYRKERPGLQREEGPKIFTLPYTPRLALSDLPLTSETLEHPYSRAVVEIAESLAPPSLEKQLAKVSSQLERAGVAVPPLQSVTYGLVSSSRHQTYQVSVSEDNQLVHFPPWSWPIAAVTNEKERLAAIHKARTRLLPERDDLGAKDRDAFLDALSGTLSLDKRGKWHLLASYSQLSTARIQEQLDLFQSERQNLLSLPMAEQESLLHKLYDCHREWADLIVEPAGSGVRHFLLLPLSGVSLFPSWEARAKYWFLLARDLRKELGRKEEALQAIERGLSRHPEVKQAIADLLALVDGYDQTWNQILLERARSLAGDDLWLQFEVLKKEEKPSRERVEEVLEPLLQQEPPEDGELCFIFARWVANHHERFVARTESYFRRAVEKLPTDVEVLTVWAQFLAWTLGRFTEAETAFRKAYEIKDKNAGSLVGLGRLYGFINGQCHVALEMFDQGVRLYPDLAFLHYHRGNLLLLMGNVEEGRHALTKAYSFYYSRGMTIFEFYRCICLGLLLGLDAVSLPPNQYAILTTWRSNAPQFFDLLLTEALLALAESRVWPAEKLYRLIPSFADFNETLWTLYAIGGQRPDLRETTRAGASQLLADYPEMRQRLKGVPHPDVLIDRFRPFAEGKSDGLGDPRDRPLFCHNNPIY